MRYRKQLKEFEKDVDKLGLDKQKHGLGRSKKSRKASPTKKSESPKLAGVKRSQRPQFGTEDPTDIKLQCDTADNLLNGIDIYQRELKISEFQALGGWDNLSEAVKSRYAEIANSENSKFGKGLSPVKQESEFMWNNEVLDSKIS